MNVLDRYRIKVIEPLPAVASYQNKLCRLQHPQMLHNGEPGKTGKPIDEGARVYHIFARCQL